MAFPSNPVNGQIATRFGRKYQYNSDTSQWNGVQSVASNTIADIVDEDYISSRITASGTGVTTYSTLAELPLADNTTGAQAFVAESRRLYIWDGNGWFNIALINTNPTITTGPDVSYSLATDGTPIVITLIANDPEGIPITWSYDVTSGVLGSTATITQLDNVFTITPSTDENDVGEFSITFTASDGINLATAASSFTLVFVSPLWKDTSLSIGTSSTNGLANSTFVDRSTNALTVTTTGSSVQSTFHPYLDNWSVEFDGSGDYLTFPSDETLNFGTGNFTIEFWFYANDITSIQGLVSKRTTSAITSWRILIQSGEINWDAKISNSSAGKIGTADINIHQWHHVALVRSSGIITLFLDGVSKETVSDSRDISMPVEDVRIGDLENGSYPFNGNISNVRLIKGSALYTTNFTPPIEKLTAISGTSLLTCQSNLFIDNSSNAHTITVNGDTKISAFNPLFQSPEYAIGENKGSAYLDGSGDYLTVNSTATLSTDNFTIEAWVYRTSNSTDESIFVQGSSGSGGFGIAVVSGAVRIRFGASTLFTSSNTLTQNTWYHVALVRNTTTLTGYLNGVSFGTTINSSDQTATQWNIGHYGSGNYLFTGYISDLRVVKGTAVYTSNFTPPTAPLGNTNAQLYMPMDNSGIFDKTAHNTLTLFGNVSTSTTQTKFADTAMYFDGTGDYIEVDANSMAFGTGDFTIEAWIYPTSTGNGMFRNTTSTSAGTIPGVSLYFSSDLYYVAIANSSSVGITLSSSHNWLNKWSHIAITRESGTARFFIDGVLSTSGTSTHDLNTGVTLRIGEWRNSTEFYDGYIENFQVIKGVAKYTTAFTPPTQEQGLNYQVES